MSKDFIVHCFAALTKREICTKYEKHIASFSYVVMCFAKTLVKYPRNTKYNKSLVGLTSAPCLVFAVLPQAEREYYSANLIVVVILFIRINQARLTN